MNHIRNPKAIRPWEHVLEPLNGYLLLGQKMYEESNKYSEAWNFGPNIEGIVPVWEIGEKIIANYGKGSLKDISNPNEVHEAQLLALDVTKAKFRLNWASRWNIDKTIEKTVEWYKRYNNEDVYELCVKQIKEFIGS